MRCVPSRPTALDRHTRTVAQGESIDAAEGLQAALDQAIAAEDYAEAARLRDMLNESGERATLEVRAANTAFYEAFDTQDIAAMRRVWGRGDHVQCMHPGSANIIGSDPVMRSWEVIMEAAGGGQRMGVRCTSVRLHISQDMAYVTCEEAVGTDEPGFGLYATNIFEKQQDEWKMVLHQAAVARV